MSLLDAFHTTQKNFDPKKDSINGSFDKLPEGEYTVSLDSTSHFVSQKTGWEQLSFKMMVIDGEHAGQSEFVGVNLDEKKKDGSPMPDFVVMKNIKTLTTIGALVGLTITDEMITGETVTDIYEKLVDAFEPYKGKMLIMTIKEQANKNDPDNPYRNYEFQEYQDDPFEDNANSNKPDDGMPF